MLYGPFKVGGEFIGADSGVGNANFDQKLRSTNASWGLRDVDELTTLARDFGLTLQSQADMPANNLTLHFVKDGAGKGAL